MKIVLCFLAFSAVVAQPDTTSDSSGDSASTTTSWSSGSSGTGSYNDAGYSGGSNWGSWGSVGGSGSDRDWGWDGDTGWDPSKELWHFRPSWNWDSPYPPEGTMYVENWGTPPTREIPSRRSFYFGANQSVSLVGATAEGGRADCGWRDWCVHLTFHSSYGVLSDFDAFVLDRYDSAEHLYGDGYWYARDGNDKPPRVFAPLVLGGFSPEERATLGNVSSWKVEEMARRFNETRTTTWTLYPESDEMDVILSFKQLYTLLPGYPGGNISDIAKREGSGATSVMMPRVLNFTGSQLFQVEYYSSLEYPQDDKNLTAAANAMTLDVVFGRRRYGSGLPWNPARPSDACDACNQQVMNHPMIARCLHGHVPENIFQDIYEQTANEKMAWDGGEWEGMGPTNSSYNVDDVVDACFGLRWLLNGKVDDGSWSSDSSGSPNAGDRRSSSGSGFGDVGYGWRGPRSGSDGDYRHNDGSRWSSEFREPVYRYDDSGSRWSSWGYRDVGSESNYGDAGSRWSSSGSPGGPNAGDWPSVRDLRTALAIARETDTGIQCFVESRCPVGNRNFAEAAGRMVVLEHNRAFVRVNFTDPTYRFYIWMGLEGLGSEGQFTTPELSSDHSPEEIAELIAAAVPNASDYNLAIDVRVFNNSEVINWVKTYNDWIKNYYNSGGSESDASAAWASYSASSNGDQFPPVGGGSDNGYYHNVGQDSDSSDGSSPDAGHGSDTPGPWWFADLFPEPEPQFTVEISIRNASVVPNILDVFVVGDDPTDSSSSNMTWVARDSELRFRLSPLNLSTFEYVPPPPYVNLTWNEDIPEYPDPHWNGSDSGIWSICSQCEESYRACDNSISCKIGVRAYLQEALSPSRFEPYEFSNDIDGYGRILWGVDVGPQIRQAASFFTAEGYDLFMNLMTCLSKSACELDLSRHVYSYSRVEYITAEPTLLKIIPAESTFVVSTTNVTTGDLESILMKYRGKEHVFEWNGAYMGDLNQLREFIVNVTSEYNADESLWTRNPSGTSWVEVWVVDQYADSRTISVTFNSYFIESEPPQFKSVSSGEYNEQKSSGWKAIVGAYRNQKDEGLWDDYPMVTWRKFSNWMNDLGGDNYYTHFVDDNTTAEDIPICRQCMDAWTQCFSNQSCASVMRDSVLPSLADSLRVSTPRSSIDLSATFASWASSVDSEVYAKVMRFFSCLNAKSCPVGYALPSDPVAPLVPVTMKVVGHFAVALPIGKSIVASLNDYRLDLTPQSTSIHDIESWLRSTMNYESEVEVQASVNDTFVRYDIAYYPTVTEIPFFYLKDDKTLYFGVEGPLTFASFQLSSNLVRYGQVVSADLLNYWFGFSSDSRTLFYYSGDIFSGSQICYGCPECLEAVTRCRNDMDCAVSAKDVLVPLLRNATLPLSTDALNGGLTRVKLDLSSALLSLKNKAFVSREGWLAFAHMLRAMSSCGCEVGFGQWSYQQEFLEPTRLHNDSEYVELRVRLYSTTQLDMWLNGNVFSYSSDGSSSPMESANKFSGWLKTQLDPSYLSVEVMDITVDDVSGSAIITMHMYGPFDEASNSRPLVNPTWIPTFAAKSNPPGEVIITPWKITLQSVNRYPPFDRLLDLLEYGVVSDDTPTSNSTTTGGSYSGDACGLCATQRQACFDELECSTALRNHLLPRLDAMGSTGGPDGGYYFNMSDQILEDAFMMMQKLEAKQKLLALLTCSATKWTSAGTSCIQSLTGTNYPGVAAYLEITQARSVFPINKGKGTNVYSLAGIPHYYSDDGNPSELTDFMENRVLGGYESSGVKVEVTSDWSSGTYTVIYEGLTATSVPFIEYTDTVSSTMQFIFRCSDPDLPSKFNPWRKWLDPSNA
ncbi:hypothetical protein PC129_g8281 [Phytophthora cactorum]|uniref:Uncharacterized protein n=1 Tax=Phytophthora cactorum TaxID=29920 RepID=A0A8T1KBX3_9STRA|nr:hypothetical protein Pcac1_g15655 [Phytophthora cactorum]KAG3220962.1 hypothetical protein PC129_g8281 [Phytophthora cactorum]KAG4048166.1 hypothetical protein PC123_g16515 [Phytophthora cactorum]KAG4231701.1 hypothetical protein PC116_g20051 [Phytophthora cactorum]